MRQIHRLVPLALLCASFSCAEGAETQQLPAAEA